MKSSTMLIAATALAAAGCGDGSSTVGDADAADLADTVQEEIDIQPDTQPDTAPDHAADPGEDDGGDIPVEPGGCMTDEECAAGEFCEFLAGVCEGPGECTARGSGDCPAVYAPVCGCDGRTYSNDCVRQAAGVSLRHDGDC